MQQVIYSIDKNLSSFLKLSILKESYIYQLNEMDEALAYIYA